MQPFPPYLMMTYMKSDHNWPTDFKDILLRICERMTTTDNRHNTITILITQVEPRLGSGELESMGVTKDYI